MWTSTIDLDFKKVLLAQLIGRFYRNIYFSSYSPLQVQNLPRQSLPKTSWVRVRNHLSGISGSDLHLLYGDGDIRTAPSAVPAYKYLYPGHEMIGEVIEIGDDVQRLRVGDRVALQSGPNCLTAGILPPCRFCMANNYNLCENAMMSPQPIGGGWSEEMLVHEQQLFQLPDTLTDEQAVMLEPTSVALHAVLRRLPKHGERVLIIGAGSIGLSLLQIVHALAPQSEISVLARHAFQVERATRLGASHIIYPRDAYVGVKRATQAKLYQGTLGNQTLSGGYDVIYDTVGRRKTLHNALRWTRAQGTIVLVGINLHMMNLDLTPIWYQEINLLGSTSHGMEHWPIDSGEQRSTFSAAVELIEQGRIAPEQLITHHFALNNYKHALLTTTHKAESRAIKVVFDYSLLPASVVPNVRASAPRRRPVTVNFDYPGQEDTDNSLEKQAEGVGTQQTPVQAPVLERKPYTPASYAVQDTPPIRSFTKEMPQFSALPVEPEYMHGYNESEDTASALPSVGKHTSTQHTPIQHTSLVSGADLSHIDQLQLESHLSTSPTTSNFPPEDAYEDSDLPENYFPTPKAHSEDPQANKDILSDQPSPLDEEFSATPLKEALHAEEDLTSGEPNLLDDNEQIIINNSASSLEDRIATEDAEQELRVQTSFNSAPSDENKDEYVDWQFRPSEVAPQTFSLDEDQSGAQIQRSRSSSRKRKHSGR